MSAPSQKPGPAVATIGANLTWLEPGVVGGSEEYSVRLLEAAAAELPDDIELRVYGRASVAAAHPGLAERCRFVPMPVPAAGRAARSKPARIAMEQSWLAAVARNDVLVHHFGGTVPVVRSAPAVVTIHDLQPLEMPENFGRAKRRWLAAMIPFAVTRAALVTTPSRFTADRLIERFDLRPDRVRVVAHGHRPPPVADAAGRAAIDGVVRGRYLLYPAIAYRHKRHRDLLALLDDLSGRYPDLCLVLTGRDGPETPALRAEVARRGLVDRVHFTGRIPAADLHAFYRHAVATVFPSAYEGFGNPALEAMAARCPLVVTNAGALPEVVGDAAPVVAVGDIGAMAAEVAKIADEPSHADDLRARGLVQARRFDVSHAASALIDVYQEVAAA